MQISGFLNRKTNTYMISISMDECNKAKRGSRSIHAQWARIDSGDLSSWASSPRPIPNIQPMPYRTFKQCYAIYVIGQGQGQSGQLN